MITMKNGRAALLAHWFVCSAVGACLAASPYDLTVGEGFVNPIGYYDATPAFSWKLPAGVTKQTAYQIRVENGWDSGWVESDQSVMVPYGGKPFSSREQAAWRVRFRDEKGAESDWSDAASIEMGLLSNADWKAQWIRPTSEPMSKTEVVKAVYRSKDDPQIQKDVTKQVRSLVAHGKPVEVSNEVLGGDPAYGSAKELELTHLDGETEKRVVVNEGKEWSMPVGVSKESVAMLRRDFEVDKSVKRARLYATARGVFEIKLNGKRVGNDYFANGFTSYSHRLDTLTYDVTDQVTDGGNQMTARLGAGWYAGHLGWKNQKNVFGPYPDFLLQMEVTYADGSSDVIVSDGSWEGTFDGPMVSSSLYDGENHDARRQPKAWKPVVAHADLGSAQLAPKPFAPVRAPKRCLFGGSQSRNPDVLFLGSSAESVGQEVCHGPW